MKIRRRTNYRLTIALVYVIINKLSNLVITEIIIITFEDHFIQAAPHNIVSMLVLRYAGHPVYIRIITNEFRIIQNNRSTRE